MQAILSLTMGYFLGCLSPAAWIGKKKHVNLKQEGTKNLGATNTTLVLGRKAGYFVLIFDMLKSIFSYKLARILFPQLVIAGILAATGAILGHCFPITMGFEGGKGLASFGGLVLAYSPRIFITLLLGCGILAIVLDYGVYLAVSATVLFPISVYVQSGSTELFLAAALPSALVLTMHMTNLRRAITREDPIHVRESFRKIFEKKFSEL